MSTLNSPFPPITLLGLAFLLLGAALLLLPVILRSVPSLEELRIHPLILYVYRKDNFFFATFPLLILVSLIFILWNLLR